MIHPNIDDWPGSSKSRKRYTFAGVDCDAPCSINVGATNVRAHKRGVTGIRPNVDDGQAIRVPPRHVSVPFAGVDRLRYQFRSQCRWYYCKSPQATGSTSSIAPASSCYAVAELYPFRLHCRDLFPSPESRVRKKERKEELSHHPVAKYFPLRIPVSGR